MVVKSWFAKGAMAFLVYVGAVEIGYNHSGIPATMPEASAVRHSGEYLTTQATTRPASRPRFVRSREREESCIEWFISEPFKLLDYSIKKREACLSCHGVNELRIVLSEHPEEYLIHP